MDQQKLNAKVLAYLKERHVKSEYCSIEFIRQEVVRNVEIEDYRLAEALKLAYYELREKNERLHH